MTDHNRLSDQEVDLSVPDIAGRDINRVRRVGSIAAPVTRVEESGVYSSDELKQLSQTHDVQIVGFGVAIKPKNAE